MKVLVILLAIAAAISGIFAAWKWYVSSRVSIDPGWALPGMGLPIEPTDPDLRALDLQVATDQALTKMGRLNAVAALWTAISVLLNAAVAIVSVAAL